MSMPVLLTICGYVIPAVIALYGTGPGSKNSEIIRQFIVEHTAVGSSHDEVLAAISGAAVASRQLSLSGYEICCLVEDDLDDQGRLIGVSIRHADHYAFSTRDVYVAMEFGPDDRVTYLEVYVFVFGF